MNHGFIRVSAATPKIRVADPFYNAKQILAQMLEASKKNVKILVFPELCLTGATCGDLFFQDTLLRQAQEALGILAEATASLDMMVFAGLPWELDGKIYNVMAAMGGGRLMALIPKTNLPAYGPSFEKRYFTMGNLHPEQVAWKDQLVPMGVSILFSCRNIPGLVVAAEVGEDLWSPCPPSISHALCGASILVNGSASWEAAGKDAYRRELVKGQSARLIGSYVMANAGDGESTQDLVFGGHNIISEYGEILGETRRFSTGLVYADVDVERLRNERRRCTTFTPGTELQDQYLVIPFEFEVHQTELARHISQSPFVPERETERNYRCQELLSIQASGLKKRLEHTGISRAVIGLSGGLDSALALLTTVKAFDSLGIPRRQIRAVTMPCFGTTDRTYQNACAMAELLQVNLCEIDIKNAVLTHFADIGQNPECHDAAYENAQARERTQVLMDMANMENGIVIGTGDLSELALGWATYNGDHMSMYNVNGSVPKTLVRQLVGYYGETCRNEKLKAVLLDILDTPVSPELIPGEEGHMAQKTEDLIGPYELHDFFLYYLLRCGFSPEKIYRMACHAFLGVFDGQTILKWMRVFYRRFFSQQFKRSCMPDGPSTGSVSLSPRGAFRMPSDASGRIWLKELENLEAGGTAFHDKQYS